MRIVEVNKDHTRLYLSSQNGLEREYHILFIPVHPKTKQTYLVFTSLQDKQEMGIYKINAAAVSFSPLTGLLSSFREQLSHEEWKYLNQEVKQFVDAQKKSA